MKGQTSTLLQSLAMTWTAAACLPLPALLMTNPATNAEVACLYLGLASAWLATEILRYGGYPDSRSTFLAKSMAICLALAINSAMFVAFGTWFPFAPIYRFHCLPRLR